jgi:hypothetical protein
MKKNSSKPTPSKALKLSLLAGAGAAGVMGQDAAAEIISHFVPAFQAMRSRFVALSLQNP